MATVSDINNIGLKTYDIYFGDTDLGTTVEDSVQVNLNGQYVPVTADQFEGVIKSFQKGIVPTVRMELQNTDKDFITATLLNGQIDTDVSSDKTVGFFGTKIRDSVDYQQTLLLHPHGIDRSDTSNDLYFWNAAAKIDNWQLIGSKNNIQTIAVEFEIYPDLNQDSGKEYGAFGSWDVSSGTPVAVAIVSDRTISNPYMSETAMDLNPGQIVRKNAFAIYMEDDSITLTVDNVAGYSATATSVIFDALSSNRAIAAGDYLKLAGAGTEYAYVESVTYSSDTAGTLTLVRGVPSGTGTTLSDGDTITLQKNVYAQWVRDSATFASSDTGVVDAGNTYPGSGTSKKGVLVHDTAGTANITATYNSVSSANLVVTAN